MPNSKLSFEKAYQGLEKSVEDINENRNLEDTIKSYEKGIEYYNTCKEILDNASQKIQTISSEVKND